MSTLGQELNRERELRGIPLQEIARQTKININHLIALEQDRLDLLPGEFFIKGTIRAFARCIGLDENQALNLYLRAGRPPSPPALGKRKKLSPQMSPGRWKKLALLALPLLLLAAVLLYFKPWAKSGSEIAASSAPSPSGAGTRPEEPAGPVQAAALEPPQAARDESLLLHLGFRDEVWISIQADDGPVEEALMQAGEQKSFSATERIVMRLGRPDQVDLTINGRKAKPFPPSSSAQTYEINKDNCRSYLVQ